MAESTANALQIDAAVDGAFTALNTTHSCFKSRQREAIVSMLGGHDTFVRLPTGYGKTIIIAVLPTAFDHLRQQEGSIVLCICPLIALMIDQTRRLKEISLSSVFLGSATASVCTKDTVMQCLRMSTITTAMIDESPDKPNIFYGVMDNMAADVLTHHIAEGIKTMGSRYPKTLVFCRRYEF